MLLLSDEAPLTRPLLIPRRGRAAAPPARGALAEAVYRWAGLRHPEVPRELERANRLGAVGSDRGTMSLPARWS